MNSASASVIPFVRKITPKAVAELMGINLLQLQRPVAPRALYDLWGTVMAAVIKQDKTGTKQDSVQFKGQFQATHCDTGEIICDSGVCFIPVMDSVLYTALKNAQEADSKARIAIAFRVGMRTAPADKPSMTGYEWDVQRLIPQTESKDDPIARLKALAGQYGVRTLSGPPASDPGSDAAVSPDAATAAEVSESQSSRRKAR